VNPALPPPPRAPHADRRPVAQQEKQLKEFQKALKRMEREGNSSAEKMQTETTKVQELTIEFAKRVKEVQAEQEKQGTLVTLMPRVAANERKSKQMVALIVTCAVDIHALCAKYDVMQNYMVASCVN
jgi:hypothetical protein